jgi:hypothetical protein
MGRSRALASAGPRTLILLPPLMPVGRRVRCSSVRTRRHDASRRVRTLYLQTLDSASAVEKLVAFYVERHNNAMSRREFNG